MDYPQIGVVRLAPLQESVLLGGSFVSFPLLTNQVIPLKSRGKGLSVCIRIVMLCGSESWTLTIADVQRLQRNEGAMISWICKVKIRDKISSGSLLNKLHLKNLDITLQTHHLR